jgi:hypothetical protein
MPRLALILALFAATPVTAAVFEPNGANIQIGGGNPTVGSGVLTVPTGGWGGRRR